VKDAMVLMFALACLGSLLLLALLRRTTTFSLPARLWVWAILNFVFFCPREYENFLWGIQLQPLTPGVALAAAMLVNLSELRFPWKILATYANGMLLWIPGSTNLSWTASGGKNRSADESFAGEFRQFRR
jgi:hypothetical protein